MEILSLLALGMVAGILAGLLGVGGGTVIVPVLVWIFRAHPEIPASSIMHIALGTSLATIMITSLSSIRSHHQRGAVHWDIMLQLTPGVIIGTLMGAIIADALASNTLRIIFGVFALLIAAQLGFGAQPAPHRQLPGWLGMSAVGSIIGNVSALVGIGGGSMTVPFLAWCNVPMREAVGTSAACGFPIAVAGAIGFMITGWNISGLPSSMLGYVHLPALLTIASASLLFAPLGAKLAHTLPTAMLKKFFALFLAGIGIKMLLG